MPETNACIARSLLAAVVSNTCSRRRSRGFHAHRVLCLTVGIPSLRHCRRSAGGKKRAAAAGGGEGAKKKGKAKA